MKAAILVATALLGAPLASAKSDARLEFHRGEGAESCPDRAAFEALVASRMGGSPWTRSATRLVRVLFSSDDAKVSGRMELLAGEALLGSRTVRSESRDCHEIAETLALGVALALHRPQAMPALAIEVQEYEPEPEPRPSAMTPAAPPRPFARIPVTVFAGSEGGYSYWESAREDDDQLRSHVWSGDFSVGAEAMFAPGWSLDVLFGGYGAERRDRRHLTGAEGLARPDYQTGQYSRESVGTLLMRAAVRAEREHAAASLGLLVGGLERGGCDETRPDEWSAALCADDLRHFVALPTFGIRVGRASGPYATAGILDTRFPAGELAHVGVGTVLRGNRRVDTSLVAAMEGPGARVQLELPVGRRLVVTPALSSGVLYDTFDVGGSNVWVRAGVGVAVRR